MYRCQVVESKAFVTLYENLRFSEVRRGLTGFAQTFLPSFSSSFFLRRKKVRRL